MSEQPIPQKKRRSLFSWSTRDILIMAVTGLIFGAVLTATNYLYLTMIMLSPVVQWAWTGLYLIPSLFIAYVIRRPGAAFLIAILYNLVGLPFAPYGLVALIGGVTYGICCEAGVAIMTRYRAFTMLSMLLSGVIAGICMFAVSSILFQIFNYALPILIGVIITTVVSCGLAGVLSKLLADAIARTGTLSGTELGQTNKVEI